jgi:hypothetical protein
MSIFGELDFGQIQQVLYPVIESLGGPDIRGAISGKSVVFAEGAEALRRAAILLDIVAEAASDGILTNYEIDTIILEAPTIMAAIDAMLDAVHGEKEV